MRFRLFDVMQVSNYWVDLRGDYVGFEVEDKFIVGYGLDIDQKYRNLPFISWVKVNE